MYTYDWLILFVQFGPCREPNGHDEIKIECIQLVRFTSPANQVLIEYECANDAVRYVATIPILSGHVKA